MVIFDCFHAIGHITAVRVCVRTASRRPEKARRGFYAWFSAINRDAASPLVYTGPALRQSCQDGRGPRRSRGRYGAPLSGRKAQRFGMGPAVVLGQNLADLAGPVCDSAVADLAARNRKLGDGHRKATGT
jgi:hypothetical protein